MRIVSYNVNGVRAAMKKGLIDWLATDPADIICLQETKAACDDVDCKPFEALGFEHHWFSAQKKGYSGVAVFTRIKPSYVKTGTGFETSDFEGRVIELGFGDIRLINAYFPSGTSGNLRQEYKYQWLDEFHGYINKGIKSNSKIIVCGDYNIAHKEIDIHDPKGNKNSTGFLPAEREWMDKLLANGWVDCFREFNQDAGQYTWWSQRFPSVRQQNKGWRIDYFCATKALKKQLVKAEIFPDVKHSDHCPIYLEIKN